MKKNIPYFKRKSLKTFPRLLRYEKIKPHSMSQPKSLRPAEPTTGRFPSAANATNSSLIYPRPADLARLPHPQIRVSYKESLNQQENMDLIDSSKRSVRIGFQDQVQVVEIPSREDYCEETRRNLWSTKDEVKANQSRNINEFNYETYWSPKRQTRSWWMCREEEDMVVYQGELVHPYTFIKLTGNDVIFLWFSKLRAKCYIARKERLTDKNLCAYY
jgi:hypothetical protein